MAFAWTDEQQAIIDAVARRESCKVLAGAGSGKTSTSGGAAHAWDERIGKFGGRGLYLAFNRKVVEEAKASRRFPDSFDIKTAHGLAFGAVGKNYESRRVNSVWEIKQRIGPRIAAAWQNMTGEPQNANRAVYAVLDTIGLYQNSADDYIDVAHVPDTFADLDAEKIASMALFYWNNASDLNAPAELAFPTTHDTYFKLWQTSHPRLTRYSLIQVDEAQDLSPVMAAVLEEQQHAQRVYVGDGYQSIYAFRGAINTLDNLDLPAYPLTASFRFGPEVAAVANQILAVRESAMRIRGLGPSGDVVLTSTRRPDAVISRTNAGLVAEAVELVESGATISIVGGIEPIIGWLEAAYQLRRDNYSSHPAFRFFKDYEDLVEASESATGRTYKPYVRLVEEYQAQVPAVCRKIRDRHVASEHADVQLSSLHKYKGQESDCVRIAGDFSTFCEAKTGADQEVRFILDPEEANLAYVAVTRAKQELQLGSYYHTLLESLENAHARLADKGIHIARPQISLSNRRHAVLAL